MPKAPEKEAYSHGACVSSRCEDEVLSLPPAAAEDLFLSSPQCFLAEIYIYIFTVFVESKALSPVTCKNFKPTVLVSICFPNSLPISDLKQHIFISLLFCSLDVQQGSHWAGIKASAGLHHFHGSGGESIFCLFNLLDKKKRKFFTQSCLTLCDPMDCILPCPSVHGILKLLETAYIPWFTAPSSIIRPAMLQASKYYRESHLSL